VIHPIASEPAKTWPADRFLAVAAQLGLEPVFIGGPGEDLSAFHPHRTLAGAPLSEIKQLLAGAALFLGNDSGPAHMAAAFGIPVVVLFGASQVDVWRPWKTPAETLVGPAGISSISVEQVLAALARLRVHA
jgi:ADP-heptose:LPS heptosyltransferase